MVADVLHPMVAKAPYPWMGESVTRDDSSMEGKIGTYWFWESDSSSGKGKIFSDWDRRANGRVFRPDSYRSGSEVWSSTACAATAPCAAPMHLRQHTTAIEDLYHLASSATWTPHTNSEENATNSIEGGRLRKCKFTFFF